MFNRLFLKNQFSDLQRSLFAEMYLSYYFELSQYSVRLRDDPIAHENVNGILDYELLKKFLIFSVSGEVVGFLLVGFGENTHPCTDYYIAEFYIKPCHRRTGIGISAIKELLFIYPGKYCYHVLKDNTAAHFFWERVKNEFGCKELTLTDTTELTDCDFYSFEFSKE